MKTLLIIVGPPGDKGERGTPGQPVSTHLRLSHQQSYYTPVLDSSYGENGGGGHWLIRMEWRPAGWSVCLPLLIFPCTIKSRSSLLAPAQPGGHGKRAVKRLWCDVMWCGMRRCYLSAARCKRFANGPSDATATPSSLASLKSRLVQPFQCRWLVNPGCVSVLPRAPGLDGCPLSFSKSKRLDTTSTCCTGRMNSSHPTNSSKVLKKAQSTVRDYLGEPVPEETLTHPPSWSSSNLYQLVPSTTIHSILPVQTACLAIFLHNLSPSPLWSTSWSGAIHIIFYTVKESNKKFKQT